MANVVRLKTKLTNYTSSRDEIMQRAVMAGIEHELGTADFFTREDLLQLRVLQSVATITRYRDICLALHSLIAQRRIIALNRTELCIAGRTMTARRNSGVNLVENYIHTVTRLVREWEQSNGGEVLFVPTLIEMWVQDQHLSKNAKRVAIRGGLKRLAHDKMVTRDGLGYRVKAPNVVKLEV